jgi:DNA-binding response OmpR family regulator
MRILLVEDDENIQAWITATLKSNDPSTEVEWEANGNDALTRYADTVPMT